MCIVRHEGVKRIRAPEIVIIPRSVVNKFRNRRVTGNSKGCGIVFLSRRVSLFNLTKMALPNPELLPPEAFGAAPGRGRLIERRVLIIGGGQSDFERVKNPPVGNGRAMALLFAKEGAHVAVQDISLKSAQDTVDRIIAQQAKDSNAKPTCYVALQGDASNENDVIRVFREAKERLGGPIDGLVCNVGVAFGVGYETSVEQWDKTFQINVRSHFLACKHGIPQMPPGSSVLLISSIAARSSGSNLPACSLSAYVNGLQFSSDQKILLCSDAASKAALDGLMKHAGRDGGRRGVRVNVLQFGLVDSGLGRETTLNRPSRTKAKVPVGNRQGTAFEMAYYGYELRLGSPCEFGVLTLSFLRLFLISNESSYVTGQVHVCDGGVTSLL